MKIFSNMPDPELLGSKNPLYMDEPVIRVNAHFHTPYSFSAFENIEEIFALAAEDNVSVLGINDFITTAGYGEFADLAEKNHRFPLFNIEFMGLIPDAQKKGIRINDPDNPGRIYLCGKGLINADKLCAENQLKLKLVFNESLKQTREMVKKLNRHLAWHKAPFRLDFDIIQKNYTKGLVRERHIAKALRLELKKYFNETHDLKKFLLKIYKGKKQEADLADPAALDNELRSILLKKGGPAYVAESPSAFLSVEAIRNLILDAGGIPCYPVLLDDAKGNFTEFEKNYNELYQQLIELKIFSIELIPARNNLWFLKEFVEFFIQRQMVVTFGTEHNTPKKAPLSVTCRDGIPLTEELNIVNYEGACIIAAHQYLLSRNEEGYLKKNGVPHFDKRERMTNLGDAVIRWFIAH